MRKFLAAMAIVALAPLSAEASERCFEPYPPFPTDGTTASAEQMKQAHEDVVTFLASSDFYQECLLRVLADPEAPPTPQQAKAIDEKIAANQTMKERVGAEYNAAAAAYNARRRQGSTETPETPSEAPSETPAAADTTTPTPTEKPTTP